jgi:hypothetical protein
MNRGSLVVLLSVLAIGLACLFWGPREMVTIDGVLVKNRPGKEAVAHLLKTLQTRLHGFLDAAERVIPEDPRIRRIRERWSGTLAELVTESGDRSLAYSLNKSAIYLCVRAPDGSLPDPNAAMFVLLHEAAHVACVSHGHTPEFWETMKFLLELAERLGFYAYVDHRATPTTLCGHVLGASPLTCVQEKTCKSAL